uniref:Anoctamin n=1 Tax=Hirondellea gigas TaxID=1518452 RepID=A0A6A7G7S5_9CRUS
MNALYGNISEKLNQFENHRTDSDYENSRIAKSFVFKFVNSFNTLFYIAFIKKHIDGCQHSSGENDCTEELQLQLQSIFITMIVVNNSIEYFVPRIKTWRRIRKESTGVSSGSTLTEPEKQFMLNELQSTFDDFDELIVQFGFVTMFTIAFPLIPLLALFNNLMEVVLDSRKLTESCRRPEPRGIESIGTWLTILNLLSAIAVFTNLALTVFVTSSLRDFSTLLSSEEPAKDLDPTSNGFSASTNMWIFVCAEHGIFLLKFAIQYWIDDIPRWVRDHEARQRYLVDLLVNRVSDVEEPIGDLEETHSIMIDNDVGQLVESVMKLRTGYRATDRHVC